MDKIKVLIVEDQVIVAEDIAAKLRKHDFEITAMYDNAEEAIESLQQNMPDLILMDIQLAGAMDGVTAAAVIRKMCDIPLVYLSELSDEKTLERAKKTTPENFLSKPFQEGDLVRAIDFAFYNAQQRKSKSGAVVDHVFLRTDSQSYVKLMLADILYLEADRAYCKVVCAHQTYTLSTSMNHVAGQIDSPDFARVHRSFVVNVKQVTGIEGNTLKMGKHEIVMSREYKEELTSRFRFLR